MSIGETGEKAVDAGVGAGADADADADDSSDAGNAYCASFKYASVSLSIDQESGRWLGGYSSKVCRY